MATNFYADRGSVFVNGVAWANIKSMKWTADAAVSVVETMTANKVSPGYKQGNQKVSGSLELAVPDVGSVPDLAFLYGQDVTIICQLGSAGDRHTLKGVAQNNRDNQASVGDAGTTLAFTALQDVNEGGPGVNSVLGF
jgi:hypothetical protein